MNATRYVRTADIKTAVSGREGEVLTALGIPYNMGNPHIDCPYPTHGGENDWRWDTDKSKAVCTCTGWHSIFDVVSKKLAIDFEGAKVWTAATLGRLDLIRTSTQRETARAIALKLSGASNEALSTSAELLTDIQDIFEQRSGDKFPTAELLAILNADEERPWATYSRGRPLTPRNLAKLLGEYGIRPHNIWIGSGASLKGYSRDQFHDAFARYLPVEAPNSAADPTRSVENQESLQAPGSADGISMPVPPQLPVSASPMPPPRQEPVLPPPPPPSQPLSAPRPQPPLPPFAPQPSPTPRPQPPLPPRAPDPSSVPCPPPLRRPR